MALTYGGIPLHVATPEEVGWIERNISVRDIYELNYPSWPSCSQCPPPGKVPYNRIDLGRLWWPVGASRWAVGHFLASEAAVQALRPLVYVATDEVENLYQPLELVMGSGENRTVETDLYMLPPRPLAQFSAANGLHLLTLVDARFFWWVKATAITVTENTTTWTALYDAIAAALDIEIEPDDIAAAYLYPSGLLAQPPNEFIPPLLDAVAASIGQRIVRQLDGTVITQNARTAAASTTSFSIGKTAGGTFALDPTATIGHDLNALVPDSVAVSFPAPNASDPYTVTVVLADLELDEFPAPITGYRATKSLGCSAVADEDDADNLVVIGDLATQIATDFYLWQLGNKDVKYSGIVPVTLDALHEVCWDYHKETMTTRVQRTCWNDFGSVLLVASDLGSTQECCENVGNDTITINVTDITTNTYINPGPASIVILIADAPYLVIPGLAGGKPGRKIEIWVQGSYPIIFLHSSLLVVTAFQFIFPAKHSIYALVGWKLELTWFEGYWHVVTWPSQQIVKVVDGYPAIFTDGKYPIPLGYNYNGDPETVLTIEDVTTQEGDLLVVFIYYMMGSSVGPDDNTCTYNGVPMTLVDRLTASCGTDQSRIEAWSMPIDAANAGTHDVSHTIADDLTIGFHAGTAAAFRGMTSPTITSYASNCGPVSTTHVAGTEAVDSGQVLYAAIGYASGTQTGAHGDWQDGITDAGQDIYDADGNLGFCQGFLSATAAATIIARKTGGDELGHLGMVLVVTDEGESGSDPTASDPCSDWSNTFSGAVQFHVGTCDRLLTMEPVWLKRLGSSTPEVGQRFIARHIGEVQHPSESAKRGLYALEYRCCDGGGGTGSNPNEPCTPGDDCVPNVPPEIVLVPCCTGAMQKTVYALVLDSTTASPYDTCSNDNMGTSVSIYPMDYYASVPQDSVGGWIARDPLPLYAGNGPNEDFCAYFLTMRCVNGQWKLGRASLPGGPGGGGFWDAVDFTPDSCSPFSATVELTNVFGIGGTVNIQIMEEELGEPPLGNGCADSLCGVALEDRLCLVTSGWGVGPLNGTFTLYRVANPVDNTLYFSNLVEYGVGLFGYWAFSTLAIAGGVFTFASFYAQGLDPGIGVRALVATDCTLPITMNTPNANSLGWTFGTATVSEYADCFGGGGGGGGGCGDSTVPIPTFLGSAESYQLTGVTVDDGTLLIVTRTYYYGGTPSPTSNTCTYNGHAMILEKRLYDLAGHHNEMVEIWSYKNDAGDQTGDIVHSSTDAIEVGHIAATQVECLATRLNAGSCGWIGNTNDTQPVCGILPNTPVNGYAHAVIVTHEPDAGDSDGSWSISNFTDGGQDLVTDGLLRTCEGYRICTSADGPTLNPGKTAATGRRWLGLAVMFD